MLPYRYNKTPINFEFYQHDLNTDLESILEIVDKHKPSIIINFSAQGEVRNSWKYPEQWFLTNCLSVVKLTNQLRKRDFIKKYISVSTPEVYGATKKNIIENHNYYPSTPYAASKLAGDLHLITLFKHYSFPVVFTRSANVYGVHQQLYRIIPRTIIYLKLGKTIELHGGGASIRTFVNIKDVPVLAMGPSQETFLHNIHLLSRLLHFPASRILINTQLPMGVEKKDSNLTSTLDILNKSRDQLYLMQHVMNYQV